MAGGSQQDDDAAITGINVTPFVDIALVLLIIFMVTAPLITTGIVDLPSVGKSANRPTSVVEVIVSTDEKLRLRLDGGEPKPVTLGRLAAAVKDLQAGNPAVPVVISADKAVKYEQVVRAMDVLQRAGLQRVGLSVKQGS